MRLKIWLLALCLSFSVKGQSVKFSNIGVKDGLSNSWVKSIHKDSRGFIWFGTLTGLNRYDGYNFKVFQHDPNNPRSLGDNQVATIYEDSKKRLWVSNANTGYVNLYNPKREDFEVYRLPGQDLLDANLGHVATDGPIFEDSKGNLWVGNEFGVTLFDPVNNEFYQYPLDSSVADHSTISAVYSIEEDNEGVLWFGTINGVVTHNFEKKLTRRYLPSEGPNSLSNRIVKAVHKDENGSIWLATWGGGLHLYNESDDNFRRFQHNPLDANSLSRNDVLCIDGNDDGKLFIGTENGGLDILDLETLTFEHHKTQIDYDFGLSSNSIYAVFFDEESQILWLGTFNGGVDYFSRWSKPFVHHKAQYTRLNNNKVTALLKDFQGNLFIGTDGGGVNIRSSVDGSYKYYRHDATEPSSLMSDAVLAILEDRKKNIWIGTYDGGLDLLNRTTGEFTHFKHESDDSSTLSGLHVSSLCEDKMGNIWVGTFDAGVSVLNKANSTFTRFLNDSTKASSISNNFVQGIFSDSKGSIYVSTMITLDIFDHDTRSFRRFDPERLHGAMRTIVMEDSKGNLWVGSANGLFRYDDQMNFQYHYTIDDGLPDNNITGILEDENHNLWLSTHNGLARLENPFQENVATEFRTYTVQEGLQGAEYKIGAYFKDNEGIMYFGGQNGYNSFDPRQVFENPNIPPVVITDLKLFNKTVNFGDGEIIPKPILLLDELVLDHEASVITFEYAALEYSLPEGNSYAFRMDGFEEAWNYVGNTRSATYTNLDPGEYVFRVKAANNDGIWNEEGASLRVKILPPFYNTLWFRSTAITLLVTTVLFIFLLRTRSIRQMNRQLVEMVDRKTKQLQNTNEALSAQRDLVAAKNESLQAAQRFIEKHNENLENEVAKRTQELVEHNQRLEQFSFISAHNLRGPIARILGLCHLLEIDKDNTQERNKIYPRLIESAKEIDNVVKDLNKILEIKKNNDSFITEVDLDNLLLKSCRLLEKEIDASGAKINSDFSEVKSIKTVKTYIDSIFYNLISNAIKYRHPKRKPMITVKTQKISDKICLIVSDNGLGIDLNRFGEKIFELYQRFHDHIEGKGMGLYLIKTQIEAVGGSIQVESKVDIGTTFKLYFSKQNPTRGKA